jgi:hypothetical protein
MKWIAKVRSTMSVQWRGRKYDRNEMAEERWRWTEAIEQPT